MPTVVVGTAGHIDHGKTTLLRALTGIDADRLPEERARGMTIDVGYAHLAFDDGVELDFVDVPGHDRLVGNMLVGAGEIDAAMLVVAADDGPRPQTLEHLALLDALGIVDGLAVVTKTDLVEPRRVDHVVAEVRDLLATTRLAGRPVLAASATTGAGLEPVRAALREVRDSLDRQSVAIGGRRDDGPLRLAVDRAFTVTGRGAVVTGSLRGGSVVRGATLRREPGGELVRVREVQVHGLPRERHDGGRTALNLAGLDAGVVHRGDVLTTGPRIRAAKRLLVQLGPPARFAPIGAWPPRNGGLLRLHIGTDQVDATLRRVKGTEDVALLGLTRPTATFAGDRAVLRQPATSQVVAGALVLDAAPPRGASRRRMTPERLTGLVAAVGDGSVEAIIAARLELHGALATEHPGGVQSAAHSVELAADVRAALEEAVAAAVTEHHRTTPLSPGMPLQRARAALLRHLRSLVTIARPDLGATTATVARLLEALVASGRLARQGETLRDPTRAEELPPELVAAMDRLEASLAVTAPPGLAEAAVAAGCPPDGIRALQASGRIVRLGDDLAWAAPTFHDLAALALEMARREPLSPAAFRDATASSRRFSLAILEDLDRRKILVRTPEGHIPGPRAPRPGTT